MLTPSCFKDRSRDQEYGVTWGRPHHNDLPLAVALRPLICRITDLWQESEPEKDIAASPCSTMAESTQRIQVRSMCAAASLAGSKRES